MLERTHARASVNFASRSVDIFIYNPTRHDPGSLITPAASVSWESAQELADDLWRAGIRPTEGKVSDKTLGAKDEHLKDLREILKAVMPSALRNGR